MRRNKQFFWWLISDWHISFFSVAFFLVILDRSLDSSEVVFLAEYYSPHYLVGVICELFVRRRSLLMTQQTIPKQPEQT